MERSLHRSLFGTLCILFCSVVGQAQLVFVADTNLRDFLNNRYGSTWVDADGYMDTQDPDVLSQTTMEVNVMWAGADLSPLAALEHLTALQVVAGEFNDSYWVTNENAQISVGAWPPNLTSLTVWWGVHADIPAWPTGLTRLDYQIPTGHASVPALPNGLTALVFKGSPDLITLPDLPSSLASLTLSSPIAGFPALPDGITQLTVSGAGPSIITSWPSSAARISITSMNSVSTFPAWPAGLDTLLIQGASGVTALPQWPASLRQLNISGLSMLPTMPAFNDGLSDLTLSSMGALTALPAYPTTVVALRIGGLGVTTLPDWPPLVDHIRIDQVMPNLVELPDFPNDVRFITTYGDFPALPALPAWPDSLRELTMYSSSINEFPPFPAHMTALLIADLPNLHCLPLLPESLTWFFSMVPGLCLPNIPPGLSSIEVGPDVFVPITTSMLCTVLNSTCDFVNPAATGSVYVDQNPNGVREGGEPGYPFATVNAQPGNITYGVPFSGDFDLPLPLDQYTLTASSNNPYVVSISPASHDAPFVNASDVDAGNDFGVVLQPDVQDLNIDLMGPWGRPGFETPGGITCGNIGSTEQPCTVTFQLDANLSWVSSEPPPTSVNGNTITWDLLDLGIGLTRHISFTIYTDVSVPLGTQLVHTATIGDVTGDETPADNTATSYAGVDGSWDPNDKRVEPTTLTPTEVAAGEEVVYTIRFQNTGTHQADRVIITDELSSDLQWSTLRLINSSHACTWVLSNEGLLRFTFEPIFLPDSTSDEPNSHGYVRFAMRPVSDLMLGESVSNTASIYFDFNEAVVTNEAVFSVDASTSVTPSAAETRQWNVWPNPVEDMLRIEGAGPSMVDVLDVTGRAVLRERIGGPSHLMDVRTLAPGRYTLRIAGIGMRAFIKR